MIEIAGQKTLYVDVDDTLAMGDLSKFPPEEQVLIGYTNGPIAVVPNQKNINLLTLFWKLGYTIIVWSQTGSDWAREVVIAFGLKDLVSVCLTKPMFYMDDKDVSKWIGPRRWRDPKGE